MSNFIYNDFNDNNQDKEPINFNFGDETKSSTSKSILVVSIICMILSALFGLFGGYLFLRSSDNAKALLGGVDVTINQSAEVSTPTPVNSSSNPSVASVVESVRDTVVVVRTSTGSGSGVIVSRVKDGVNSGYYIITNTHVIDSSYSNRNKYAINVIHPNGTIYRSVEVVGACAESDIAILKIYEARELKCATFANNDYSLVTGEDVFAIGNSLGQYDGTVTKGSVSYDKLRKVTIDNITMDLIQLDISVYPGNSGGGLFNLRGELVGIVNAKIIDNDVGRIGFAIPHTEVLDVYLNCLKLSGK